MKSRATKGLFQLSRTIGQLDKSQSIVDSNEYNLYTVSLDKSGRRSLDEQKQVPQVLDNLNKGNGQKANTTNNVQNANELPPRPPQLGGVVQNKNTTLTDPNQGINRLSTMGSNLSGALHTGRRDDSHNAKVIVTGCQRNKQQIERHIKQATELFEQSIEQQKKMRYIYCLQQELYDLLNLDHKPQTIE